ncbi:MAG: aspartyl protease family protein [Candidatus Korarchaeota archaeon]|nr:aspartyl protease family protein [Thermoproteota archaeon]MCR8472599.1 aspartyl protease family protein [Thermoproteota archaeon]
MEHIYVDMVVRGAKGEVLLRGMLVDTGASYTVLDEEVVKEVGAWPIPYTIRLELGDGNVVEANVYAIIVSVGDRSAATLVACFKGARNVLGVRTLEDLGLKADPISGKLEPTRPAGLAYFYCFESISKSLKMKGVACKSM